MAQADPASRKRSRKTAAQAADTVPDVEAAAAPDAAITPDADPATPRRRASDAIPGGLRPEPTLRILETRVLRGANYWAREPVIRQVVDLGVLEEFPSNRIPGFVDALVELLPTLEEHACSLGRRGGFITRLRDGTWAGHVAEHIALEFQNLAGTDVRHGKTRGTGEHGRYNVIFEYREEQVGIEAGRKAVGLVNHLVAPHDPAFDFDLMAELESLILMAERLAFGPSTQALIDEAAGRDIPYMRLDRYSLVQFGQGVHQQRIRATMTSRTSGIAVDIASDKKLTNRLLDSAGLPVPRSEMVETEDEAVAAARRLGYPCVIKPLDGNHGRGVALDLRDEAAVRAAWPETLRQSRGGDVIVESYITGRDYRCLVIGGKLAAVAERVPASVTGDGETTIRELVDITNADPRRGIGHEKVLTRIRLDANAEAVLAAQGFTPDDVPPAGVFVKLALTGNMSTGGTSIDRTLEAHPDNVEIAETAARVVGLDIAGIDFICPDIEEPVRETGGGIVEVNAAPGFRMHTHPTEGEPQYVAKPVIDLLFPPGTPARIPILAVTGTNGKTTTVRMIAHVLKLMGRRVGMTSTDGIVIDGRLMKRGDMSGPKSAQMVLQNPTVDTAVFEVARGGILREGLGYDRNDVAVVTNVTGDHLGIGGIDTLGQLANVKGVVVEAVPRAGTAVLNADDHLVYRMGRHCSGRVVLFSMAKEKGEDGLRPYRRARRARQRGVLPRGHAPGRAHRAAPRSPEDAGPLHPPHPGHVRRAGADERRQRARGRRRRLVDGRPHPRHPPGPPDLLDVVLPGAGPAQPGGGRRDARGHRLLPQRGRDAPAGGLREPDDGGAADARGRARGVGRTAPDRAGDRRHRDPGRPPGPGPARVRRPGRHGVRRAGHPRGPQPARAAARGDGVQRRRRDPGRPRRGWPGGAGRQDPGRGIRRSRGPASLRPGRPRGGLRRRRRGRVPAGDGAGRAQPGWHRLRRSGRAGGAAGMRTVLRG